MFDRLYNKYENKLKNLENSEIIYYYFNPYGSVVPIKYYNVLNIISNMFSLRRASNDYYTVTKTKLYNLITDDYYTKHKLIVGSFNIVFTLLTDSSLLTFMITNNNICYIETITGFSSNLLNILQDICREYGISYIETYSIYEPITDNLLKYGFVKNIENYLIYNISTVKCQI